MRCSRVTRIFPVGDHELRVLDGISFDVGQGEFVSIMGQSGSGKTTLINIIGAMDIPTSGSVELEGTDITHIPEERMHRIRSETVSHVFQQFFLIPTLTVMENLMIPLFPSKMLVAEAEARVRDRLELVGMADRINDMPTRLSGGQQQRIAIARALMNRATILLADEPTGNLDRRTGEEIMDLLLRLNRSGLTVIMVTHNPALAAMTHRVLHLRDGKVHREEVPGQG